MYTLLFVDDEQDILDSMQRSFRRGYKTLTANCGSAALDIISSTPVDLIISDQRMPDIGGDAVLKHALQHQPEAIRILLTGYADMESLVRCVNDAKIYQYISKPWEPEDLRLTVVRALESLELNRQLEQANQTLKHSYLNAVTMLSMACEGKDEDTGFHVQRVQHYTEALALELGVAADEAEHMGLMSILHDVGKLYVPDAILKKPAKLDAEEWAIMQQHAQYGVKILGDNPFYEMARLIAGAHHENYDGSGYPNRLAGADIPLPARIAKLADVFDALTSERPYKAAWPMEKALECINGQAGTHFDPQVVAAMNTLVEKGVVQSIMQRLHGTPHAEGEINLPFLV
ncbi:MAG: response regulator [Methylococcaceae bacterium]|nr:MAG: response regulator [Methylococcaceae bacterium]